MSSDTTLRTARAVARYGLMEPTGLTDQFRGRQYRCPCGVTRWSAWDNAGRHARSCPDAKPEATDER